MLDPATDPTLICEAPRAPESRQCTVCPRGQCTADEREYTLLRRRGWGDEEEWRRVVDLRNRLRAH
jgi:hypothetical protein